MFTDDTDKLIHLRGLLPRFFLAGLSLFLLSGHLLAAGVNVTWSAPSAGSAPAGYKIFYGTSSGSYSSSVDAGKATTTSVSNLTAGVKYYFAARSYDASGNQSAYSNELNATTSAAATLTVDFTASPGTTLTQNQVVTFTPTVTPSTATIGSWSWNFGNGATSTGKNPSMSYASSGTYTVALTAKDSTGQSATTTKTGMITVLATPVAGFTSSTNALTANFTDTSAGNITSRSWNFGESSSSSNTSTAQNPSHTYSAAGAYSVSLTVTGPGGTNTKTSSVSVTAAGSGGTSPSGLVAAYGFEEVSGSTVVDASGKSNHGAMQNTSRITNGRFGRALSFNGVSSLVKVNDSASLDLTTGMTLEAWVYNTKTTADWSTVLWKDITAGGDGVYYLYGASDSGPIEGLSSNLLYGKTNFPVNTWVHLAATYDGKYQRLYVNGTQVAAQAKTGAISTSTGALFIGNDHWTAFFKGYIDELRIYNRALTAQEVMSDLNTPVNTANPPKPVYGNQSLGSTVDALLNGAAVASKSVAQASSMITGLNIYLDAGTTSTSVIAGVYSDNNGHPGTLLTSGTLASPKPGAWNSLTVPPVLQTAGKAYWIAFMGPNGTIQLRDYVGTAGSVIEQSASTVLTTLPSTWTPGAASADGPVSGYGLGY